MNLNFLKELDSANIAFFTTLLIVPTVYVLLKQQFSKFDHVILSQQQLFYFKALLLIIPLYFFFSFIPFIPLNNINENFFSLALEGIPPFIFLVIAYPLALICLLFRRRVLVWISGWIFTFALISFFWGMLRYIPEHVLETYLVTSLFILFVFSSFGVLYLYLGLSMSYYTKKEKEKAKKFLES